MIFKEQNVWKIKCGQVIWINKEAMTTACAQPWETAEMLEELGLFIQLN